jgi:alanine dehydrogenase
MPAACARSASLALEHAVLPYVRKIAAGEITSDLTTGVQVKAGKVTHELLARDTRRPYSAL